MASVKTKIIMRVQVGVGEELSFLLKPMQIIKEMGRIRIILFLEN